MRQNFIELLLRKMVEAVLGAFIPGAGSAFDQLKMWAQAIPGLSELLNLLNSVLGPVFGGIDFTDPPTPEEIWQTVVTNLIEPLNILLGPNSPLNLANAFGRLQLEQLAGGLPLSFLTTAVPNLLASFSAATVPTSDGWSFDATADGAKVVCDGTTKTLYMGSGVIKVESDQPLNTSMKVKYSGVTSGAGQTIRYVLDTFTSADGSGTPTPVTVAGISNPSGTISSPVTLGNASWAIPPGVQSVRPVLVVDSSVSAGTVHWLNTPVLEKPLTGALADGLPAALAAAGQDIRDAIVQALGGSGTGHSALDIINALTSIPNANINGLAGLLNLKAAQADLNALAAGFGSANWAAFVTDLFATKNRAYGSLTSASPIPAANLTGAVSEAVSGLGALRDALANGLGLLGSGFTNAQAQNQAVAVSQSTAAAIASSAAANTQISQSQGQNNAGATGAIFHTAFGGAEGSALNGSDFTTGPTTGDICIRGGYAGIKSSNALGTYYAQCQHQYTTDDQSLIAVLGDQGASDDVPSYIFTHCNSAMTQGAYCKLSHGGGEIGYFTRSGSSWTFTRFSGATTTQPFFQGSSVEFRNTGNAYQVLFGGIPVLGGTDTGGNVATGASYRYGAIGSTRQNAASGWFGSATYDGFRFASVTLSDYITPTYQGSGATMIRAANGNVVINSSSAIASFFDTVQVSTSDITANTSTPSFTVSIPGWYKVAAGVSIIDSGSTVYRGNVYFTSSGSPSYTGTRYDFCGGDCCLIAGGYIAGDTILYLNAGDSVSVNVRYTNASGRSFTSLSSPASYFSIALINRSQL